MKLRLSIGFQRSDYIKDETTIRTLVDGEDRLHLYKDKSIESQEYKDSTQPENSEIGRQSEGQRNT